MITESRFADDVILKMKVNTEPVRMGLGAGKEIAGDYTDYRGKPVTGASILIPETGWVVVTEIEFSQAFAPLRRMERALISLGFGLALLLGFIAWKFTRTIVQPLEALNEAELALMGNHQTNRPEIFVPEEKIPHDEIGEVIHRRNQRVNTLLDH